MTLGDNPMEDHNRANITFRKYKTNHQELYHCHQQIAIETDRFARNINKRTQPLGVVIINIYDDFVCCYFDGFVFIAYCPYTCKICVKDIHFHIFVIFMEH